ncbi:CBS domain-containing protein [Streptomyces sp. NPDC018833]
MAVFAEELMSSPAVTVHADATIAEAARIMA